MTEEQLCTMYDYTLLPKNVAPISANRRLPTRTNVTPNTTPNTNARRERDMRMRDAATGIVMGRNTRSHNDVGGGGDGDRGFGSSSSGSSGVRCKRRNGMAGGWKPPVTYGEVDGGDDDVERAAKEPCLVGEADWGALKNPGT